MSYDLVALSGVEPLEADRAADIYHRLCDGQAWDSLLRQDPNVAAFVKEITRLWPQLDDVPEDEVDASPWSVEFELSPAHCHQRHGLVSRRRRRAGVHRNGPQAPPPRI